MRLTRYLFGTHQLFVVVVVALTVLIAACAPSMTTPFKELDVVPQGKALIYIYRGSQANHPTTVIGNARVVYKGETLAWFPYGGYYPLVVDPGEVEISTVFDSVTLDTKVGQAYFLRISSRYTGRNETGNFIGPVSLDEAKVDLAYCQLLDVKKP